MRSKPLAAAEKFKAARQDSFDRGTVALAALFAGEAQLSNSNPSFGEGVTRISPLFRYRIWRLRYRRLYDGGGLSNDPASGPALFPPR